MSETTRLNWDDVLEMNVYMFFNIVAYSRDKANFEKEQIKNWERKN